jgi:tetratricopeptide (TPR) repeat protein
MAEAGCLELMGDYGQAIEVRTRALQIDPTGRDLCENYHYLWRLHFWNGNLDAAEEFAALHAECVPGNLVYAYVYPALIHAEAGRLDQALNLVDAMVIDDATAERAIWAALMYRLLGAPEAAEAMVQESADLFIPKEETPTPAVLLLQDLYDLHTGAVTAADLVDGADKSADRGEFIGAVHYHAGILALASGDRVGSSEHLEAAYRVFDGAMGYTYHADVLRRKLQTDAEWPRWLGPSAISNSGGE